MSHVPRRVRLRIVLAAMSLGWFGGCSDGPIGPPPPPPYEGLIVSDTIAATGVVGSRARVAQSLRTAGDIPGGHVAYVSLTPGTAPTGTNATIQLVGGGAPLFVPVRDGGFDPLLLGAEVNDSIAVVVRNASGTVVFQQFAAVRGSRPPVVVRTDPPKRKTDVPLNSAIIIVFSEPITGGTATTASVRILRGTAVIPGTVIVLDGTGAVAAFVPDAPLAANTEYQVEVTQAITDLDGEALQSGLATTFTTGTTSLGPPASIQVLPDSELRISVGETYPATAVVRDAAGNQLINVPLTWSVEFSDSGALTVSSTGLLEALGEGFAGVTASAAGLSDWLYVFISPQPAASVVVAPSADTVAAGDTIVLTATLRDAAGRLIKNPVSSLFWATSNPAVATVTGTGVVRGVGAGDVTISATSGTATGTAAISVIPPMPVATVSLSVDSLTVVVQGAVYLTATLRDENGSVLPRRPITWKSTDTGIATIDSTGVTIDSLGLVAVRPGSVIVIATSEGVSDSATITVTLLEFAAVSAGGDHTCGLTNAGTAYCWGGEKSLGIGALQVPYCPGQGGDCSPSPVVAVAGLTFTELDAVGSYTPGYYSYTCGLVDRAAYCWGPPPGGDLSLVPVARGGSRTFSTVNSGIWNTCGVTAPSGDVHCWFGDQSGEDVPGGLNFVTASVNGQHTCGLATDGAAYCWGTFNGFGQFGSGDTIAGNVPVPVTGGLTFSAVTAGGAHTCGIATSGAAYCWGLNAGLLGVGTATGPETCSVGGQNNSCSRAPVAVAGGHTFTALSAGFGFTCGIAASGLAYCWGENANGQLGDSSTTRRSAPVAVAGGLTFAALSAGDRHACGITTSGVTYCWGANYRGKLGNGSLADSNVPVKVAGQP